ncbi:MAG: helix-turn-helix domain-containing protein [Lachnospiraceae bacterium]|nr:helix-turn-helix domain-containing protein [Lachnospiraceae bacterium]
MGKKKIEKTVKELNKLTGLNFQLDLSEIDDTDEAVIRLEQIVDSWKEKNSKNAYWRRLLTGEIAEDEMTAGAARFHVKIDERRALYIVETPRRDNEMAVDILRQLFVVRTNDLVIGVDGRRIALVRTLKDKENLDEIRQTARTIVDMLNVEALIRVRVAYADPAGSLEKMPKMFREAETALEIGRIFYMNENIVCYNSLGIGRLIYRIPTDTCRRFLKEVYGSDIPVELDEETRSTVDTFFAHNLNVSETARRLFVHRNTLVYRLEKLRQLTGLDIRTFDDAMTFRIASMVAEYLRERSLLNDGADGER